MSSVHYTKGKNKSSPEVLCPFPLKVSFNDLFKQFCPVFGFSLVCSFLPKKQMNNVSLVCCYVKYEALYCCPSGAIVSCSCTQKQQTKSYWLFLLLHLGFESDRNESQNEVTAFRTYFVSQSYRAKTLSISLFLQERPTKCFMKENSVSGELSNLIMVRFPPEQLLAVLKGSVSLLSLLSI